MTYEEELIDLKIRNPLKIKAFLTPVIKRVIKRIIKSIIKLSIKEGSGHRQGSPLHHKVSPLGDKDLKAAQGRRLIL